MSYREFYHRNLPHWQSANATFFIAIRLAGSLPEEVLNDLRKEREAQKQRIKSITDQNDRIKRNDIDNRIYFRKWDNALNKKSIKPRWLEQNDIAEIEAEAIHYRDGKDYDLLAFCIMPNHVHIVFHTIDQEVKYHDNLYNTESKEITFAKVNTELIPIPLHKIMQSLKLYTARQANLKLGRQGAFWHPESYDHVVRNDEELSRIVQYVINIPVEAGLVKKWNDWLWIYWRLEGN